MPIIRTGQFKDKESIKDSKQCFYCLCSCLLNNYLPEIIIQYSAILILLFIGFRHTMLDRNIFWFTPVFLLVAQLEGKMIINIYCLCLIFIAATEWKKVYSLSRTANLTKGGYFESREEAFNKNPDDEEAELFSILDQLEPLRTCGGDFHFKLCYPGLAENFSFPCNEWTQTSNPVLESIIEGYNPIRITFNSENGDFPGLGLFQLSRSKHLINDRPYVNTPWFSVGTMESSLNEEGKFAGPSKQYVEKAVLYVNPGILKSVYLLFI